MQQLPVDTSLLWQYVDGHCTKEQLDIIQQYLHDPAYKQSLYDWLRSDWQQVSEELFPEEAVKAAQYRQFLTLVRPAGPVAETVPVKYMFTRRWWRAAAAAVFLGAIGWFGWQWQQSSQQQKLAVLNNQWLHLHNEAGKKTEILLPDSSQVYLGAASSLQYNKNYGITNREIILEGEAYFIVKHAGRHLFSVHTGSITTVDIGTAFNIRYRANEPLVQVAVAEGAVNVLPYKQSQVDIIASLTRQQQLNFDTATRKATIHKLPEEEMIGSWRQGILAFRQQSLGKVAIELERYYGIRIRFANPQTAHTLITTTIRNVSVTEALDIIALTAGVAVTVSEKEVVIK